MQMTSLVIRRSAVRFLSFPCVGTGMRNSGKPDLVCKKFCSGISYKTGEINITISIKNKDDTKIGCMYCEQGITKLLFICVSFSMYKHMKHFI